MLNHLWPQNAHTGPMLKLKDEMKIFAEYHNALIKVCP